MSGFIRNTISLCPVCHQEIDGKLTEDESGIWVEKNCINHGYFRFLVERDKEIFQQLEPSEKRPDTHTHTLTIPITYNCNLNCAYCFVSSKEKSDIPFLQLKDIITNYKGYFIGLSGGEPTLNKDLPEYIRLINQIRKSPVLITNGIKLSSESFLKRLTEAGNFNLFFSLDSLKNEFYEKLKGPGRILQLKMKALENVKKNKIHTCISSSIYKGANDLEIGDIFRFCAKQNIPELRIRTIQTLGRNSGEFDSLFISDLVTLFCEQTGFKRKTVQNADLPPYYQSLYIGHSLTRRFYFINFLGKIIPLNFNRIKISGISRFFLFGFQKLKIVKTIIIRFLYWPTAETVYSDGILNKGVAHLYNNEDINFYKALILKEKI